MYAGTADARGAPRPFRPWTFATRDDRASCGLARTSAGQARAVAGRAHPVPLPGTHGAKSPSVSEETLTIDAREGDGGTQLPGRVPVLVIVWAREGGRVGESFLPGRAWSVIGRGGAHEGDPCERLLPVRMRPAETKRGVALKSPSLSRVQLKLRVVGACVEVTNVGRRPLRDMSGRVVDSRSVAVGELVDIESSGPANTWARLYWRAN